jgi:hypothetical protein
MESSGVSSAELRGYTVDESTRLVLLADTLPHTIALFAMPAFGGLMFAIERSLAVAVLMAIPCVALVARPMLLGVVVERKAIVRVRRFLWSRPKVERVPFESIEAVTQGNEYHQGLVWMKTKDDKWYNLSFRTYGRQNHTRYTSAVALGGAEFYIDPKTNPEVAATAFCRLLAASGLTVEAKKASKVEHIMYLSSRKDRSPK